MAYVDFFRKYAVFSGRTSRGEFWMAWLINIVIAFLLGVIGGIANTKLPGQLYILVIFVPIFAISVRRLHDIGKSGWWLFFGLVPLVGYLTLLYFYLKKGDEGTNQYDDINPSPQNMGGSGEAPIATKNDFEVGDFVRQSREAGKTDEEIRLALIGQGWVEKDIIQALGTLLPQDTSGAGIVFNEQDPKIKRAGNNSKWVITCFVILFIIAGWLLVDHFVVFKPDLFSFDGTLFTVKSRDSQAYAKYSVGGKTVLEGNFFQYMVLSGKVDMFGQILSFSYLDPEGYKIFQSQYGGKVSNCPASFLNQYTKVVELYAANEQIAQQLHRAGKKFNLDQRSIEFKVAGRYLSLNEARLADGRSVSVNFGSNQLFLVEEIISL